MILFVSLEESSWLSITGLLSDSAAADVTLAVLMLPARRWQWQNRTGVCVWIGEL